MELASTKPANKGWRNVGLSVNISLVENVFNVYLTSFCLYKCLKNQILLTPMTKIG